MTPLRDAYLILFLTAGSSLRDWHTSGLLPREAELYLRLRPHVGRIGWVTYGGASDLAYQDQLPGIDILCNRWRLPIPVYIQQLPWLHRAAFERASLLKAEQTGAVAAALRVSRYFGKPLIARSGFSLALFTGYEPEAYTHSQREVLALEKEAFGAAAQIVFTTEEMRAAALHTHPDLNPEKIRVIPNYVNTERFAPPATRPTEPEILFVGRLTAQKNVENLLTAVAPLRDVPVKMIGSGELREVLEKRLLDEAIPQVRLLGNVPNSALPAHFQTATLYVQPSRYEGHPKTIFEAMACGLPVVVGDAPGIRQFIRHGETGWLCDPENPAAIREGITALLNDAPLREKIGAAARRYVVEHFALDAIVPQERAMLEAALQTPTPIPQPEARPILKSVWTYGERIAVVGKRRLGRNRAGGDS